MIPLQISAQCTANPSSPTIVNNPGGVVTWSTNTAPAGDVYIESATTLRVLADVSMCQNARIYVKRGARLEINGATIRGFEGFPWNGIDLWGNSNLAHPNMSSQDIINGNYPSTNPIQAANQHGVIVMTNGAALEDAFNAITTKNSNQGGHTGGIIIAQNAGFINNRRSVEFLSFGFDNVSSFDNCRFEYNGEPVADPFKAFVTMWDVHRVSFINQTSFSYGGNGNVSFYTSQFQGPIDIYSLDADYTVENNAFLDLRRGIHAQNTMVTSGDISIENSIFQEQEVGGGILFQGVENSSILNNSFVLDNVTLAGTYNYGLYLDQCDAYRVEGNNASNVGATSPLANVGVLVNLTGDGANEIYRNGHGFFSITNGIITQNQNSRLQLRCNDLEEVIDQNIAGLGSIGSGLGAPFTMAQLQGDCNAGTPAGNTFNPSASGQQHIYIENAISQAVRYRHHSNNPYVPIHRTQPQVVVINEDCFFDSNAATCPDRTIEYPCSTFPFCRVQEADGINQNITQLEIDRGQETPDSPAYIDLTNQIAYSSLQRDLVYNKMVREGMQLGQLAAVITELEQLTSLRFIEQKLIPLYLAVKDYTKLSQALANFVPQNSDETLFKDYYSTISTIHSSGRTCAQMTPQEETVIRNTAATTTHPLARKAQNILTFFLGEYYPETYLFIANESNKGSIEYKEPLINIFPNPTKEQFNVQLSESTMWGKVELHLIDFQGRIINTYSISDYKSNFSIPTSKLSTGIYWLNVLNNGEIKAQQKVMIVH